LELNFNTPATDAVLLANGWVDWPDGSTFRAASQESMGGLVMPYLQMQDASGQWITVNNDMGMPAGKPKTIAVLHFISASRKLRILTTPCVYWDEIFLSETAGPAEAHQQQLPLLSADLHFRGFSESVIDPQRKQPDTFLYNHAEATSFWNPTPGLYTRYGDVRELAETVDNRLIIMGSGDELKLLFDASKLAPLPAGWTRDFLLKVDGWAKDRDPNTAFSQTVEPLPFHNMSRYPYPLTEHFPVDETHRRYQHDYNTRPALRLLRPAQYNSLQHSKDRQFCGAAIHGGSRLSGGFSGRSTPMTILLILLIVNSAYLAALPAANLFYIANIPIHLILGLLIAAFLIWQSRRSPKIIPLLAAALIGIYLIPAGPQPTITRSSGPT
jgi:hypothetical protein